jgi:hypothetical protein
LGGAQRKVLVGHRKIAVQRQHQRAAAVQCCLRAADFAHAGQEGEDVAAVVCQCCPYRFRDGFGQVAGVLEVAGGVMHRDRVRAAGAFDHGGVQQRCQFAGVGGGRHRQNP